MTKYELVFITDSEKNPAISETEELISKQGGKVLKQDTLGKRDFAYIISGKTSGHYFVWQLNLAPDTILNFKNKLNLDNRIMRYLLLKKDK